MILYPSFTGHKSYTEPFPTLDIAPSLSRTFDDRLVAPEKLRHLLDAVRWSASALNLQPWRFIITSAHDAQYEKMLGLLDDSERTWAQSAPVLLLAVAQTTVADGKRNPQARHDTGHALAQFTVKAITEGLFVQMTHDYASEEAIEAFHIPAGYEPLVMIALGYQADSTAVPAGSDVRDTGIRIRKNLTEIVFDGDWERQVNWLV